MINSSTPEPLRPVLTNRTIEASMISQSARDLGGVNLSTEMRSLSRKRRHVKPIEQRKQEYQEKVERQFLSIQGDRQHHITPSNFDEADDLQTKSDDILLTTRDRLEFE